MHHLILCREYPPTPYPPGGIGTYVQHITRLLAEAGDVVHVVAARSAAAPAALEAHVDGRLVVHRLALDGSVQDASGNTDPAAAGLEAYASALAALARSAFPAQAFALQAALVAERLVAEAGIDVIEAQEWEAPLYYFQLRRALGLGPRREPPCIVHLHSPTEFIFRYNEWETSRPDYLPTKRREDYTIGAADALLCPSRYLAAQAEAHFGLPPNGVQVIPLPMGDAAPVQRSDAVWESGAVCFIGRLEPRKGVVEWIDAAVRVAAGDPRPTFDFVGADMPYLGGMSVREFAAQRIPASLRPRFRFIESRPRSELPAVLARAWACVVPSRWENFPNACVEAMASGAPVIASPAGGMAEMVEDGRSGWVAAAPCADALAAALRRALDTPPADRAAMGRAAARRIGELCANARVLQRHREFRAAVAACPAGPSTRIPPNLPWAGRPLDGGEMRRRRARTAGAPSPGVDGGIAVVVACEATDTDAASLEACLTTVEAQTEAPSSRTIVLGTDNDRSADAVLRAAVERAGAAGWNVLRVASSSSAVRRAAAARHVGTGTLGVAFLSPRDRLREAFVECCANALRRCPEVGIVSPWVARDDGELSAEPCAALPYQLLDDGTGPVRVFRTAALHEVGGVRADIGGGAELWDASTAVLAEGWVAVTYPAVLADRRAPDDALPEAGRERARAAVLARVPEAVGLYAVELVLLLESRVRTARDHPGRLGAPRIIYVGSPAELVRRAVRRPDRAALWVLRTGTRVARRFVARTMFRGERRGSGE